MKKIILIALVAFWSGVMFAQTTTVSGTVTAADDGSPLPYVTVLVKGTSTNIYTDETGHYSIKVPADGTLVFTLMGFITQEIPVNGKAIVNTSMHPDAIALDETIVVAYGTAKKGTYTGAASVLKSDAIKDVPTASFENALNGRVAGLMINGGSGQVGSSGTIRIRGTGSMEASNEPLYVIDGIPATSGDVTQLSCVSNNVMSTLNPSDIASITVLKDAAASSLYGSRAANGVIMITTKKGQQGKLNINFKATVGISPSWATDNYEPASYQEQKELMYEMRYNQFMDTGKYTAEKAKEEALKILNTTLIDDPRGEFDWEKALFRTGVYQSYDLSVSGATEKSNFYTSFSYSNEDGRNYNNDFERFSGRANYTQKIGKIFEFTTNFAFTKSKKTGFNDTDNGTLNYFQMSRNRLYACYWPYGDDNILTPTKWNNTVYNTLYYDNYWENYSKTLKISVAETVQANLIPEELTLKSTISYDSNQILDFSWYGPSHFYRSTKGGQVDNYSTTITKWVSSTILSYNKTFKDKHTINALVGFEAEANNTDYMSATANNLPNDVIKVVKAGGTSTSNGYSWGNSMASVLSKVDYNYDHKYFISGSYRRDGSSKLGPQTRWGNFWSVAASWKINNENFLKNVTWLTNLRLRASYGVNGTLPTANYSYLPLYKYSASYFGSSAGLVSSIADDNLSWETSYTYNIGLEAAFFNNRLSATIEYFNRDSKDLLQNVPISRVTGFTTILTNIGEMNNRGFEIGLEGDIIASKNWTWNLGLTASFIRSKVTKLYNGEDVIWYDPTGTDDRAQYIYREGYSPMSFYGNEYAGVEAATGKAMWFINPEQGEEYTADGEVNGRPITYSRNRANEVIMGCADPKVYGGIHTSVAWKGIGLDMNFTYALGGDTYDSNEVYNADDGLYRVYMQSKYYYDNRWTENNKENAIYPRRVYDAVTAKGYQSRKLHPGDYLRLKNLSLSYSLPQNIVKKIRLQNLRFFATATNLFTWSKFNYYDPEVNVYGTRGWEMPATKTYTFGIDLVF